MLYSLIYKNPPFNKFRDTIEKISAIVDERHVIDFPCTADPMVIAVLKGCLDRNPRNRPSIEQLLSHPYLMCTNNSTAQSLSSIPDQLRTQLGSFMEGGKLTEEAKVSTQKSTYTVHKLTLLLFNRKLFDNGCESHTILLRAILNSHLHTLLYLISYPIVNTKGA